VLSAHLLEGLKRVRQRGSLQNSVALRVIELAILLTIYARDRVEGCIGRAKQVFFAADFLE
jgi:hypothetical protein